MPACCGSSGRTASLIGDRARLFRWKALSHERAIQFEAAHAVASALVRRPVNQAAAVECDRRSGKERIMTSSIQELVAQARSQVRNLTVDEFARELEADTVTLIDIREPDEVGGTGAIPGAIQAPRGMLEFWADPAGPYHCTEFDPASRTLPSATPTSRTWTAD
jgi:hypothetical protein